MPKVEIKPFGLSFSTSDRGFNIKPDGFLVCNKIFDALFERFDEEMMKKRVEGEFRGYAIKNAI